ncbi:MAG: RecX family transcriptional regulator, partial [Acidaminococcaceae bacterium]|nr:RecX family transcriptional regulator [Acidaminococcaceae bacterium]
MKHDWLKNIMAEIICGWSCRKNIAERYINGILAQLSEAMEQERSEYALGNCLKRNPEKYDPATREGRATIGRFLYARGFASKYIQKSINNIHGSV